MSPLVMLFMVLTLFAVLGMLGLMVLTALDAKYVHPALHRLQHRLQEHMVPSRVGEHTSLDEATEIDGSDIFVVDAVPMGPPMIEGHAMLAAAAVLPAADRLLFLRVELVLQLGFDLDVRGRTVNLTRRQYRKFVDYTGLAFDTIETPETCLAQYGITTIHVIR